jgi:hypothetical protein
MSCLYYCKDLQKVVPCTIVPNVIRLYDHMYKRECLIQVNYDDVSLGKYNLTMNQIMKYCSEYINIHELYPCETQDEIDYFNNHIGVSKTVYPDKELSRYEKLYSYLCNIDEISSDFIYHLSNLFITDLQFKYLTQEQQVFMKSLSDSQFSQSPEVILIPICMKMLLHLFDKYTGELFENHTMSNYNNYTNYNFLFPLTLNVNNIKFNMNLIRNENPNLFL